MDGFFIWRQSLVRIGGRLTALLLAAGFCLAPGLLFAVQITDVFVTNISTASVTLVWVTDEPSGDNVLEYGIDSLSLSQAEGGGAQTLHRVQIIGLGAGSLYQYRLTSDGAAHEGIFRTASFSGTPILYFLVGRVLNPDGVTPAADRIALVYLKQGINVSAPLYDITGLDGRFAITLTNARDSSSLGSMHPSAGDSVRIVILDVNGRKAGKTVLLGGSPCSIGDIVIDHSSSGGAPGDINTDGVINIWDLLELLRQLSGQGETSQAGDVDRSGEVDIFDLLALLGMLSK